MYYRNSKNLPFVAYIIGKLYKEMVVYSACAFDQLHDIYQLHLVKCSDILIGIREEKNLGLGD